MPVPKLYPVVLPAQYLGATGTWGHDPYKRLMAAVLQRAVDDCRGSSYRRATGCPPTSGGSRRALAYMASTDRTWPFSFENLCAALDLDASHLRRELGKETTLSGGIGTQRPTRNGGVR
jgi:hypothetical protein